MARKTTLPTAIPIDALMRLTTSEQAGLNASPPLSRSEREARDVAMHRQKMRSRPYWQRIVAANGGNEPAPENLRHLIPSAPTPECGICGGLGWLRRDVPVGHPQFGKPVPCACKEPEITAKLAAKAQRLADLTAEMRRMTFEAFDASCDADAYAAARAFVDDPYVLPWLYLEGDPGGGKTHLLAAIANDLLSRGETVMFRVVPRLLDWLRAGFAVGTPDMSFAWRFDEVCNVPVLLLDDLGAEQGTPWAWEKLFVLLNHRYAADLRTVISTNCMLDQLDDRIRSRISDTAKCQIVHTTDIDYRTRPQRARQRRKRGA